MSLFLFRFWPVLIPLAVYLLWWETVARKAVREGRPRPHFREGPLFRLVLAMLVVAILCFLFLGARMDEVKGEYVPPHMENGVMVPGQIREHP